jgi:hypothetical protein
MAVRYLGHGPVGAFYGYGRAQDSPRGRTRGTIAAKSSGWDENRISLRTTRSSQYAHESTGSRDANVGIGIERPPFNRVMISRAERSRGLLGDRKVYGGAFRLTSIELPRCSR